MSVKNQLKRIFQKLCYKAYGQFISTQINSLGNSNYKVTIANDLYEHYQKNSFRYSEPGTTPKQIAEDIQLHFDTINLKNQNQQVMASLQLQGIKRKENWKNDFSYQIDEFGNFRVKILPSYHQKVQESILQIEKFCYVDFKAYQKVNENLRIGQLQQNRKIVQSYIFCLSSIEGMGKALLLDINCYRIWHYLSMMIKQRMVQGRKVKAYKYLASNGYLDDKINSIEQIFRILGLSLQQMQRLQQYQLVDRKNQKQSKHDLLTNLSYIGCLRNEKIFYEKHFKALQHKLITIAHIFPQNIPVGIVNTLDSKSIHKLNRLFAMLQPNIPINLEQTNLFRKMIEEYQNRKDKIISDKLKQNEGRDWSLGSKIVLFGDLLSQFDFSTASIILQWIQQGLKNEGQNNRQKKIYSLMKQSFGHIVSKQSVD